VNAQASAVWATTIQCPLSGCGTDGWRGLFILATDDIDEARRIVATDPVIVNGEMVAEYHKHYGSAALMLVGEMHDKVASKKL
jgi:hypothetical protein